MKIKCKCILEIKNGNFHPLESSSIAMNITKWKNGKGFGEIILDLHEENFENLIGESTELEIMVVDAQKHISEGQESISSLSSFSGIPSGKSHVTNIPEKTARMFYTEEEVAEQAKLPIPPKPISSKPEVKTAELKQENKLKCITNFEEFVSELNRSKGKKSNIDPNKVGDNSQKGKRERAAAIQQKIMEETIDVPAWIVNAKYAMISINDLDLSLGKDAPVNLAGKYTAAELLNSKDLASSIKNKLVNFVSIEEKDKIFKKLDNQEKISFGLQTYDGQKAAKDAIENSEYDEEDGEDDYSNDIDGENELETETPNYGSRTQSGKSVNDDEDFSSIDLTDLVDIDSKPSKSIENKPKQNNSGPIGVKSISRKF